MSEADYPYKAQVNTCKFDKSNVVVKVTGCLDVKGTEEQLRDYLYQYGPVAIGKSPLLITKF